MTWKTSYRSFYYDGAPEPADPILRKGKVALLVIDVQNTYLERPDPATLKGDALKRYHAWTPFHDPVPHLMMMLDKVLRKASEFDILHFHIDHLQFPLIRQLATPAVTTLHAARFAARENDATGSHQAIS